MDVNGFGIRMLLACLVCLPGSTLRAQVELSAAGEDHVAVVINGQPFCTFYLGRDYAKPFVAPLRAADGIIVTRRWPMEKAEGDSHDHPHHKGLWIGFGDVNGVNFWETEAESKPSGDNPKGKGRIQLEKLNAIQPGAKSGEIEAVFAWVAPDNRTLLDETRTLTFYADEKIRRLDVESVFRARVATHFADTKEGFFAIRVADSMSGRNGGIISNSEGAHTEKDVWGRRADWADYEGKVDDQKLGILILDDARNPRHPPRWHARDYGLFADNPFGAKAFDPKTDEPGGYTLAAGSSARFRYRVIVHGGDTPTKRMAQWYKDFNKGNK